MLNKDHFLVRPTSQEARKELVDYLEGNGFTFRRDYDETPESTIESIYPIIIDMVPKTYYHITMTSHAAASVRALIPETEFYDIFESDPKNFIVWRKIFTELNTVLLYEGYTFRGKPYGAGTVYYPDGKKYQEGLFGIKGLLCGKEYYANGQCRFDGVFRENKAYGPNAPEYGTFYEMDGNLLYHGDFEIRSGGVGYPTIVKPKEYGPIVQKDHPDIKYMMWEDMNELTESVDI